MRAEEKTEVKNSVGRMIFVVLAVVIQAAWIVLLMLKLEHYSVWISLVTSVIAFIVVLKIYSLHTNAAIKMPWIMLILVFPVMGLTLYLLVGNSGVTRGMRRHFEKIDAELNVKYHQNMEIIKELEEKDLSVANQSRYIWKFGNYPVYKNTDILYFSDASYGLEAQKKELLKAEKFIFMEYHAIEDTGSFGFLC